MKRLLILTAVIVGSFSVANAQDVKPRDGIAAPPGWCSGCTQAEKIQLISNEAHAKQVAGNNSLGPGRPKLSPSSARQYGLFKTNFLVNNDSDKKIKRITWECTLTNRETKATIQTFTLVTEKRIAPHKSVVLSQNVAVSIKNLLGGKVVDANQPNQTLPNQVEVDDTYLIKEIEYTDGSIVRP